MMNRILPALSLLPLVACVGHQTVDEHTFTGAVDTLLVDAGSSDVDVVAVEGLDGARIVERATFQDERPRLDLELVGGQLTIVGGCETVFTIGVGCDLDLTVEVPATASMIGTFGSGDVSVTGLERAVDLALGSGDVTLDGLTGDVVVTGGSGDLFGRRLEGAELRVKLGSGDVDLEQDATPEVVRLETGSGDVRLVVPAGSYDLSTDTNSGDVAVSGLDDVGGAQATITVTTGSGDVELFGR